MEGRRHLGAKGIPVYNCVVERLQDLIFLCESWHHSIPSSQHAALSRTLKENPKANGSRLHGESRTMLIRANVLKFDRNSFPLTRMKLAST
jgi:hypothetical protein